MSLPNADSLLLASALPSFALVVPLRCRLSSLARVARRATALLLLPRSDSDLLRSRARTAQTEGASDRLHPPRISKDGTHHEHPPARDEMRQVVRQALDVFAPLLLEALHFDDLGYQHVIGL